MRVATYYRVSTKGQGDDDRYGLPRQRNEVAAYIDRADHEVDLWIKGKRPALGVVVDYALLMKKTGRKKRQVVEYL